MAPAGVSPPPPATGCQGVMGVRGIPTFGKTGTRWQDWHPMARLAPDNRRKCAENTLFCASRSGYREHIAHGSTNMDNDLQEDGGTAVATAETIRLTIAELEAAPALPAAPAPASVTQRLLSLDAYRGPIIITLAANGFGLAGTAFRHFNLDAAFLSLFMLLTFNGFSAAPPDASLIPQPSPVWAQIRYQFDHVEWTGCAYWDLIQPSFMFMVGVAMAYSYAKRRSLGDTYFEMLRHAMTRSLVLIFLGIFLIHEWSLMNVLTQIGLGYTFLFLLWGRSLRTQAIAAAAILVGTWALYMAYLPWAGIDLETGNAAVGVSPAWGQN